MLESKFWKLSSGFKFRYMKNEFRHSKCTLTFDGAKTPAFEFRYMKNKFRHTKCTLKLDGRQIPALKVQCEYLYE